MKYRIFSLLLMYLSLSNFTYASEYDCQKFIQLSSECAQCTQNKNCNSYHATMCPTIPKLQNKCQKFLEKQNKKNLEEKYQGTLKEDNSPYPLQKNKNNGLTGNNLNKVIPDRPLPAPGMDNKVPDTSKDLTAPPNNFIMRSWY
ncbi:MAG: hypothetical protein VX335_01760 [Pseudomonadota bacterium]|nr:hypothetical protein [Pseudomonadota bacterium]